MAVTVTRYSLHSVVKCTCGFRQSVFSDHVADRIAAQHRCQPRPSQRRSAPAGSLGKRY